MPDRWISPRTKLFCGTCRRGFFSSGARRAIISSFVSGYCALAEEIFYFLDVSSPGRAPCAPCPCAAPTPQAAKAHRSLAHPDVLQRHLVHAADRARHAAVSSVLTPDRPSCGDRMPHDRAVDDRKTTCPYCGVGCGVLATPDGKGGAAIAGDPDHPANFGRLCSKGSALGETLGLEGRLLHPMIRVQQRQARARRLGPMRSTMSPTACSTSSPSTAATRSRSISPASC